MPAGFLQQDGEIDRRAAGAAVFRRQDQAEPAVLGQRLIGFARRTRLIVAALA